MALVVPPPISAETAPARRASLASLSRVCDRRWFCWLCLSGYCGWLFFYGLTAGELYRTENLRAIIAEEFLRSGNWIVPTLYGEPLFTKPPGMYAAIALVSWPFGGVQEWTARLPSAIAATLTTFLFYWYFGRQFGRRFGLIAGLMLPISCLWLDKSTTAEIDMLQVFWISASILFFLRGLEIAEEQESTGKIPRNKFQVSKGRLEFGIWNLEFGSSLWFWWMAAMLCVAAGVLTKWTGAAFFYGTVVPLLWWRGRLRLLIGRHHLVCAAAAGAICLAWAGAAIGMTSWHDFYGTVSREALMRLSPAHHHRPYPWSETLIHPLRLSLAGLPCSAFALFSLLPGFAELLDEKGRRLLEALHCWAWPNLFFWTVIPEHAVRHSFPLSPALAGLAALVWIAWLQGSKLTSRSTLKLGFRWINASFRDPAPSAHLVSRWLIGLVVLWLLVKLVFVEAVLPRRNPARQPKEKGELLAAIVPQGNTLYLFRLKDEGIMFYYGRPVRRLPGPAQLASSNEPLYCILDDGEWRTWPSSRPAEMLLRMPDEQGDPIVLARISPCRQRLDNDRTHD